MRRCPRSMRYCVAVVAPARLSARTLGMLDGPACGSTATIGPDSPTSSTVGVTRMIPSVSVPLSRETLRRSHPECSLPCPLPEYTMSSKSLARIAAAAPLSSSALNGSMSATRMPMTLVRRLRRLRATRLDSYPRSAITAFTRLKVSGATP